MAAMASDCEEDTASKRADQRIERVTGTSVTTDQFLEEQKRVYEQEKAK